MILKASRKAGYQAGEQIYIALDPAISELYQDGKYVLAKEGRSLTGEEMVAFWADCAQSTRSSRSKTAWPRTTGMAG